MTFDASDPRLTAYALGELDDHDGADDRAEVEAMLAASPEAQSFVEEVRATARLLAEHLQREPSPGLAPEHHRAIEQTLQSQGTPESTPETIAIAEPPPRPARPWYRPGRLVGLAIAAGMLGVVFTVLM